VDLWSSDYVRTLHPEVIAYDDANEDQNVTLGDILKHEYKDELALDDWVYNAQETPNYGNVEPPLKDMYAHPYLSEPILILLYVFSSLGRWHGYFYEPDGLLETRSIDTMITFVLEPADGEHEFKANAWSIRGPFTITGSWSKDEDDVTVIKFKMTFQKFQSESWSAFFDGRYLADRNTLTGVWGFSADSEDSRGGMQFRRIQPHYLALYPSIRELLDNKARALWRFATAAVRDDVRRARWSWSYFARRRKDRQTVLSLGLRDWFFGTPLNDEESKQYRAAAMRLTAADACFYISRISRTAAYAQIHV
jgi:hypothetical protein